MDELFRLLRINCILEILHCIDYIRRMTKYGLYMFEFITSVVGWFVIMERAVQSKIFRKM